MGDDDNGHTLTQLFKEQHINTAWIARQQSRITTAKTRIISRNQQMMRLDDEMTIELRPADEAALLEKVRSYISAVDPDIIIFEDYNKGVLTEKVIEQAIALCRASGVITAVDPKRKNFFSYQNVDIFKPNMKEVQEGLNLMFETSDIYQLRNIHEQLHKQLQHKVSLITLSEKGVFYNDTDKAAIIPSHIRNVADVSGAGDTVIAVAALVYAATKNLHMVAEVANIAGGLVCEEVGTVAIDKNKLLHECELLLS
jgi:rfaE bifunctional protein kinase chain/domain